MNFEHKREKKEVKMCQVVMTKETLLMVVETGKAFFKLQLPAQKIMAILQSWAILIALLCFYLQ